jgi:hypothetical protein
MAVEQGWKPRDPLDGPTFTWLSIVAWTAIWTASLDKSVAHLSLTLDWAARWLYRCSIGS